jgi:hypothetical protein
MSAPYTQERSESCISLAAPPTGKATKPTSSLRRLAAGLAIVITLAVVPIVGIAGAAQAMCTNKPPDYPGCTSAQLRPGSIKLAKREFTGHQRYYRHHQWGQHNEGAMWKGMSSKTNHILTVKYARFVRKYRHHNHGHFPRYRTFKALKRNSIGGCIILHKRQPPDKYCHYKAPGTYQITGIQQNGVSDPDWHFVSKCNGVMVGGAASGATLGAIATVAGGEETGGLLIVGGAASGAFSAEVGCQVTSLYNMIFPGGKRATTGDWGYN